MPLPRSKIKYRSYFYELLSEITKYNEIKDRERLIDALISLSAFLRYKAGVLTDKERQIAEDILNSIDLSVFDRYIKIPEQEEEKEFGREKYTKVRKRILGLMKKNPNVWFAESYFRSHGVGSLDTVRKVLWQLEDEGIIKRSVLADRRSRYIYKIADGDINGH